MSRPHAESAESLRCRQPGSRGEIALDSEWAPSGPRLPAPPWPSGQPRHAVSRSRSSSHLLSAPTRAPVLAQRSPGGRRPGSARKAATPRASPQLPCGRVEGLLETGAWPSSCCVCAAPGAGGGRLAPSSRARPEPTGTTEVRVADLPVRVRAAQGLTHTQALPPPDPRSRGHTASFGCRERGVVRTCE